MGSTPSVTFSATVNTGTSMKCWCTMPMPAPIASLGELNTTGSPSITIWPSSGPISPYRTFISVVLPAPFSPSRAWIWPGSTTRSIWSLATREPNLLVMPRSSSRTGWPPPRLVSSPDLPLRVTWRGRAPPGHTGLTGYTGLLVAGLIVPFWIWVLICASSEFKELGTLPAKSWYGASVTPPLVSVPM